MPERHLRSERGFTIVEVMVAMVVLVVGLFGAATIMDHAARSSVSTKAREGGVALQREIVEAARSIQYDSLTQASIVAQLRAADPALADTGDPGWQIRRRGITYTVSVGACSVDDPSDKFGTHDAATFCATGTGAANAAQCRAALGTTGSIAGTGSASGTVVGDCGLDTNLDGVVDNLTESAVGCATGSCTATDDTNPDDFKRIVVLVRWTQGEGARFALQSETMPFPGFSGAPRITSLTTTAPNPLTTNSPTVIPWLAKTNRTAQTVSWSVNGITKGSATSSATNQWTFNWDVGTSNQSGSAPNPGEVLDATYQIGAKAFGNYGVFGPTRTQTLTLNRRRPYPPAGVLVAQVGDVVKVAWLKNPEGDIEGYRIYRTSGSLVENVTPGGGAAVLNATSTRDPSPPASGTWTYYVVAVDQDPNPANGLREGDQTIGSAVPRPNQSPSAPSNLQASRSGSTVTLTWSASPGDPDGSVVKYQVYRDGQELRDRYGSPVSASGTLTFTDGAAGDGSHTYYVAAVDDQGAESDPAPAGGVIG